MLVDALTTILGFGALMVANHRGLESLGRVLSLGVTTCTISALVLLPALLTMLRSRCDDASDCEDEAAEVAAAEDASVSVEAAPVRHAA